MRTIRRKGDFRKILGSGKTKSFRSFSVIYLIEGTGGAKEAACGFSLPRKFGGSVQRNRARRRLKEAVRLNQEVFPPGMYLFIAKKPALDGDFGEITEEMRRFCEAVRKEAE